MTSWFPDFWARLGSRDAISWVTFVVLVILQVSGSFAASGAHFHGREGEFFGAVVVAVLPMMATLALGWLIIRRATRDAPRPVLTLAIFETALLIRALTLDAVLVHQGFTDAPNLGYRILASHTSIFLGLILTAFFVSASRDFTRQTAELTAARSRLVTLREGASKRLEEKRVGLVNDIRTEIAARLERGIRGTDLDATTLRNILDDVVRPLSYDLADRREQFVFETSEPHSPRILWQQVFRSALMGNPLHPLPFAVWMAWTASQLYILMYGSLGWALGGTSVAVVLVTVSLARWAWAQLPPTWGLAVRSVLLTLTFEAVALLIVFTNRLLFNVDLRGVPITTATSLNVVVFGWVIALVASIGPTLRAVVTEREASALELRREVVMLNATYREMTASIARVLHGPVQDAVTIGLQRFSTANNLRDNETHIADDIYDSIRKSLELMAEPTLVVRNVTRSLEDLRELWDGIAKISIQVDEDAAAACEADMRVANTVTEVVREAVSNAVRHGSAKHVTVTLSRDNTLHAALVLVSNDGGTLVHDPAGGLGTRLLDDLTLSWVLQQQGTEVELRALVPLDASTQFLGKLRPGTASH